MLAPVGQVRVSSCTALKHVHSIFCDLAVEVSTIFAFEGTKVKKMPYLAHYHTEKSGFPCPISSNDPNNTCKLIQLINNKNATYM
jgi:hypothetical protein